VWHMTIERFLVLTLPLGEPVEGSLVLLACVSCTHDSAPGSALDRQPALAAVLGVVDEPVTTDEPPVLRIGEAEGAQPRGHVLSNVRPCPDAGLAIGLDDLPGGADGPAGAVRELDHVVQRILQLHLAAIGLLVGPLLSAVP